MSTVVTDKSVATASTSAASGPICLVDRAVVTFRWLYADLVAREGCQAPSVLVHGCIWRTPSLVLGYDRQLPRSALGSIASPDNLVQLKVVASLLPLALRQ